MKKNVSGQAIGAQMVSATDGSPFTGSVTCYVCGDAGTQAAGSVGAGACTHEGNGYHTYAPAQAETNYDLIAFTFLGTGAVPATVQVFTGYPQTGDAFARLGAPAGASFSADVAAVKAETALIVEDTGTTLPAALTAIDNFIDTEVAAIKAKTDNLPSDPADQSAVEAAITAATSGLATAANLAVVDTMVDSILADTGTDGVVVAVGSKTGYALTSTEHNNIADATLKRDWTSVTGAASRSLLNAMRFLRNKWSISGATLTVTEEDDSTPAWTAALTTDAAADAVTGSDPA